MIRAALNGSVGVAVVLALACPGPAAAAPDVASVVHDVAIVPATGEVIGGVTFDLRAGDAAIADTVVTLDQGLVVSAAASPGRTIASAAFPLPPFTVVQLSIDPPVAPGETVAISVTYGGVLACATTGFGPFAESMCDLGDGPSRFQLGSAFARVGDPRAELAVQTITLHTPSGSAAFVTGEPVSQSEDGVTTTATWQVPRQVLYSVEAFAGFATTPIDGLITLHHPPGDVTTPQKVQTWLPAIASELEAFLGAPLPFDHIDVVKLDPAHRRSAVYAAIGVVVFNDFLFDNGGDLLAEETLAHEFAHLWWATSIPPADVTLQSVLTEGLATLFEYDYTAHRRDLDPESYLARRAAREADLWIRYLRPVVRDTPVVAPDAASAPSLFSGDSVEAFVWQYVKTSAVLDHLRVAIGNDAFHRGLSDYTAACRNQSCSIADFEAAMSAASDRPLAAFFTQWFHDSLYPELVIEILPQAGDPDGVEVKFDQPAPATLRLELWIELDSGERLRTPVTLSRASETVRFDVPGRVLAVRPNPRHDAFVRSRSVQTGDVSFDGDVDGVDLIRCAWQRGKKVEQGTPHDDSALGLDLDFDPRCDFDQDADVGDDDVQVILDRFGAVRQR